ncbi:CoA-binding protein [Flavobacterium sp. NKUCC04_CG]|uniref:CoA-binding protein n=1 Tax=Flavobacterium sp. NKUCC04_CG TaxID=2842121 RepID=UPI001C5ACB11|nr:CoA-binding protein [Flavobacterium sp. NKUCC04_CG]MBW3520399.1 CoA-binding protein [Flavobacterium sp. NKUCC04_CG]
MKKSLVIGASLDPQRYSFKAISMLLDRNNPVEAIGLEQGVVFGIYIHNTQPQFTGIDTINMYINRKSQEEFYDYILCLNPKRVIFNPGTENPFLYSLLLKNNIEYDEACTLIMLSKDRY